MIRTERLVLRRARASDLADLHTILSDPRAMRYWSNPAHSDIAQTQAFLDGLIATGTDTSDEYVIEHDGQCIGKAGIWAKPELGFILHPAVWGKGVAFEALDALIPHLFRNFPDMPALTAECDPRNTASVSLLRKLGFDQIGFENKNFDYGGIEMCDTAYFELRRDSHGLSR